MNLRQLLFICFLFGLVSIQCSHSLPFVSSLPFEGIDTTFDFTQSKTIAVYINPSGRDTIDSYLRNIVGLGFISRGYRVINVFPKVVPSISSRWIGHQASAETLIQKTIARSAEFVATTRLQMDSVDFYWGATRHGYYQDKAFRIYVEIAVFDKKTKRLVAAYQSVDTMRFMQEPLQIRTGFYYHEPLFVLIERSLTKFIDNFPFCSLDFANSAFYHFPLVLLVDKSYRKLYPDWKNRLELRMIYVNEIFRDQFDMQFDVRGYRERNSEFSGSLEYELEDLRETTDANDTVYLGITYDRLLALNWKQRSRVGVAFSLGTQAVISAQPVYPDEESWNSIEEAITIVHELGHIFGAPHVLNEASIMYPQIGAMSYLFDPYSHVIIENTRHDFSALKLRGRLEKYLKAIPEIYNIYPSQNVEIVQPLGKLTGGLIRMKSTRNNRVNDTTALIFNTISDTSLSYATLGYLAFSKHHWNEAIALFSKSIELRSDFTEVLWYISRCYTAAGNKTEAASFLKRSKELGTNWITDD